MVGFFIGVKLGTLFYLFVIYLAGIIILMFVFLLEVVLTGFTSILYIDGSLFDD